MDKRFLIAETELTRSQVAAIKDRNRFKDLPQWKVDPPDRISTVNAVTRNATRSVDAIKDDPGRFPKLTILLTTLTIFIALMAAWAIDQIIG